MDLDPTGNAPLSVEMGAALRPGFRMFPRTDNRATI
jgi:hypothetical protein